MQIMEHKLDEHFSVVFPNFGDSEIRAIQFAHPNVTARFFLPVAKTTIDLTMMRSSFFSFTTSHAQNVVDQVFIYPDRTRAELGANLALPKTPLLNRTMVVEVKPIVGPVMICLCEEVNLSKVSPV